MIHVSELKKTFTTYERGGTFREALLSLFVRKRKTVDAVKGISFDIKEGELVGFRTERCGQINHDKNFDRHPVPYFRNS